ncbi:MAG: hypothetical protein AAF408_01345 [Pseudomonadota bacterium]
MTNFVHAGSTITGTSEADMIVGDTAELIYAGGSDDVIIVNRPGAFEDDTSTNAAIGGAIDIDTAGLWTDAALIPDSYVDVDDPAIPTTTIVRSGKGDYDYFSVTVGSGETITVDLDFGFGPLGDGVGSGSFNPTVQLFDQTGTNLLSANDDGTLDIGSSLENGNARDPRISHSNSSNDAQVYLIRVSANQGAVAYQPLPADATYTLNVSVTNHAVGAATSSVKTFIDAGSGDDFIIGGLASDTITGGTGNDTIFASLDGDTVEGGAGADVMDGGTDTSPSTDNADLLSYAGSLQSVAAFLDGKTGVGGDAEGDVATNFENLLGSTNNDTLTGDAGDNSIGGSAGADIIYGGNGNDTLEGGAGGDVMYGGTGIDSASYANSQTGVTANLQIRFFLNGDAAGDRLFGVENLIGSELNDFLTGDGSSNTIWGRGGDDNIGEGLSAFASDVLYGGAGNDTITATTDQLRLGDFADGGTDTDELKIVGSRLTPTKDIRDTEIRNFERLRLDEGSIDGLMSITASARQISQFSTIRADSHSGDQITLTVYLGSDTTLDLSGVTITGFTQPGDAIAVVGSANAADTIMGPDDAVTLSGLSGNDTLIGFFGDNQLFGGGDDDVLRISQANTSNSGIGVISGDLGNDTLDLTGFTDPAIAIKFDPNTSILTRSDNNQSIVVQDVEVILSGAGNDSLSAEASGIIDLDGGGGNDTLIANFTPGTVSGGDGNDVVQVLASSQASTIEGGDGHDILDLTALQAGERVAVSSNGTWTLGGATASITGIEEIRLGDSDDQIAAQGASPVTLAGAGGNDTLFGSSVGDLIYGGNGNDTINGASGAVDSLFGGSGNDHLTSDAARAVLDGGKGNDTLMASGDGVFILDTFAAGDIDVVNAGAGTDDTVDFSSFASAVWVDLQVASFPQEAWTRDQPNLQSGTYRPIADLSGVENIIGTAFGDDLRGNAQSNSLAGGGGNDTLSGYAGNDVFVINPGTGDGVDSIFAGAGRDIVMFQDFDAAIWVDLDYVGANVWTRGTSDLTQGAWREVVYLHSVETFFDTAFSDQIQTGSSNDTVLLTTGNDTLNTRAGDDTVSWNINGDQSFKNVDLGAGNDQVILSTEGTSSLWFDANYQGPQFWTRDAPTLDSGIWRALGNFDNAEGGDFSGQREIFVAGSDDAETYTVEGGDLTVLGRGGGDDIVARSANRAYVNPGAGSDTVTLLAQDAVVVIDQIDAGDRNKIIGHSSYEETASFEGFESAIWAALDYSSADEVWTTDTGIPSSGNFRQIADLQDIDHLTGTAQNDYLRGDTGANRLIGGNGNDTILGRGGDDDLDGGVGNDVTNGEAGNDTLRLTRSDPGDLDLLTGGDNTDMATFDGFTSAVWIGLDFGGPDVWTRDAADLSTGAWRSIAMLDTIEIVEGSGFSDEILGGSGNDTLLGAGGNDTLNGRDGADVLMTDPGNDTLLGGIGNDRLVIDAAMTSGIDMLDGGTGNDTLDASGAPWAIWVDLDYSGTAQLFTRDAETLDRGNWRALGSVENIEVIDGSVFSDEITAGTAGVTIAAWGGNDTLIGLSGRDVIDGGVGNDTLSGGGNSDLFLFDVGYGNDTILDFDPNEGDVINIDPTMFANFAAIMPNNIGTSTAGNLLIFKGGDSIELVGWSENDIGDGRTISSSDFTFLMT